MMDHSAARENEHILHALIGQEDSEITAGVGLEALRFLAMQMSTEKFKEFLQNAIDDVSRTKNTLMPKETAATPAPGTMNGTPTQ